MIFCHLLIISKLMFLTISFGITIRVSNSVDPDQARNLSGSWSKLFHKVISRQGWQVTSKIKKINKNLRIFFLQFILNYSID